MSDELLDDAVELYPVWRQALIKFKEARFAHDEIVSHAWFYEAFGYEVPDERSMSAEKYNKLKLQWLSQFKRLQAALLEQHQIDLVSEPGLGYRIMPPREQSKHALEDMATGIKKAIRNGVDRSTHVNTALLSADERRRHTDNLARIGALSTMFLRTRKLPSLDEE